VNLRRAVNLCIDRAAMVKAASQTYGVAAVSDIGPGWWGYSQDSGKQTRDVAAGRRLIEASGWTAGPDGIYVKDGGRLAATIYVRTDASDRVRFVDLLGLLARDCGMDLRANQEDFGGALRSIAEWPNTPPGSKDPFDVYFLGWISGLDPVPVQFTTAEVSREEMPNGQNMGGFSNGRIDEIVQQLATTYDLAKRAALYGEYQAIIVDQQPALFAWHYVRLVALRAGLVSLDGPLDLNAMNWSWAPERLVLIGS
jgi:peptide/nickel transport system substrate-binding protein